MHAAAIPDNSEVVLCAYDLLWMILVARIYQCDDGRLRIQHRDSFPQRIGFSVEFADTIAECKRLIKNRHGMVFTVKAGH